MSHSQGDFRWGVLTQAPLTLNVFCISVQCWKSLEMLSWQEPGAIQMGHEEEPAPAGEVGEALQV